MKWRLLIAAPLLTAALFSPAAALAGFFNPHLILSDEELRDASAMTYGEVLRFLREKGGLAEAYDTDPADGLLKNSAQLIYDASQRYRVNPKYLLALIQKESSAVETAAPTQRQLDWATGYSLCDSCSRTSPIARRNQGFGKQVDSAAAFVQWYYANAGTSSATKVPGVTYSISRISVTPRNKATAALYSYTPHLHGNRLLWSIWNKWFSGMSGLAYPDGSLVRNERTGAVALIQNGRFRPILSRSVLQSRFNESQIITLNAYDFSVLQEQRMGSPVKFPDYSLVRTGDGSTFLLVGPKRRKIASPQVFAEIGFNPEEVEDVSLADIADYDEDEPITMASAVPAGSLAQNSATGAVFYVEEETKYPIWDRAILSSNFPGRPIVPMPPARIEALKTGPPVKFAEGALLRAEGSPSVYVVSGGKKRSIPSEDVFNGFGYRWEAVKVTSAKALGLMETGDPLVPTD